MKGIRKNTRVELFSQGESQSITGQPSGDWVKYCDVMASISQARSVDYAAPQQTVNEYLLDAFIWFRSDVKPGHRARVAGDTFEVVGRPVNVHMKNRELSIKLRAVE